MTIPFTYEQTQSGVTQCLSTGRWANADLRLFEHHGSTWVIKDFSPCPVPVRLSFGAVMVTRELQALTRLQHIAGIPRDPFRLNRYALGYRFIPGTTLKQKRHDGLQPDFFLALEQLVLRMHAYNIVHLDIRYMRNILVDTRGQPALIDFQSSLRLDRIPRSMHNMLKMIDISGVYKCWEKSCPGTLDTSRRAVLERLERKRWMWIFKGYPMGTRLSRR